MDNIQFDEAFKDFVEKRIYDALINNSHLKQSELLKTLEDELLSLLPEENDRDRVKEIFFKILSEQNYISYEAGLSDSTLLSLKLLQKKDNLTKEYLD